VKSDALTPAINGLVSSAVGAIFESAFVITGNIVKIVNNMSFLNTGSLFTIVLD
jgi:hypothetical protein